jgi:hypothetical protein
VAAGDERITLTDVAVGEVFIAGGQSNMEFWMRYDKEVEDYRPTCDNPRIRFYDQPKCSYPGQTNDFDYSKVGIWRKATPKDLDYFSAVGYYMARGLEMVLDVPVGIVGCNYGGTTSAAWMTPEHARAVQPELAAAFDAKLQGLPYEELLAHGRVNVAKNDKGSFVILHFENATGGMQLEGAEVNALEVLCEGEALPFRAAARGDELIVMLEGTQPGPIEVRFAWSNWFRTNLYNGAEIPALPFALSC